MRAKKEPDRRVVVLCGDAELNEGSNWESILLAPALNLAALTLVVIDNHSSSIPMGGWPERLGAFGWDVAVVGGHDRRRAGRGARHPARPAERRDRRHPGGRVVMDMRTQLGVTAIDLLEHDPRAAVVLADISVDRFAPAFALAPGRVVNVGIMEQTLIGVAAGFAMEGFHVIAHTIAPFLVERPFEQVKDDLAYQGLGGTLVSIGAPYDYGTEGGTHHAPGDVQEMLAIPGAEVLVPGTAGELDVLLRGAYANGRLTYLRASGTQNDRSFDVAPGRIEVLRRGSLATVVVVGPLLSRTLQACDDLDVSVVYATSVRPFDADGLVAVVGEDPLVIAVEPFYEGTLTPALAEALRHVPSRFVSVGVPRRFITAYGTPAEHDRELEMDVVGIRRRIVAAMEG